MVSLLYWAAASLSAQPLRAARPASAPLPCSRSLHSSTRTRRPRQGTLAAWPPCAGDARRATGPACPPFCRAYTCQPRCAPLHSLPPALSLSHARPSSRRGRAQRRNRPTGRIRRRCSTAASNPAHPALPRSPAPGAHGCDAFEPR